MRRVVVTGMGIVSCIGDNISDVADSLKAGRSGISRDENQTNYGFRSQVSGRPAAIAKEHVAKRSMRFMADTAGWASMSLAEALEMSGLTEEMISNPRTGIICLLYTSPSPRDQRGSRMPSSA